MSAVASGAPHPQSVVWVVVNGRLWRCALSQLRHGTDQETAQQEQLTKIPCTFNTILTDIKIGEYTVIREGDPFEQAPRLEQERHDPEMVVAPEQPASRRRIVGKTARENTGFNSTEVKTNRNTWTKS